MSFNSKYLLVLHALLNLFVRNSSSLLKVDWNGIGIYKMPDFHGLDLTGKTAIVTGASR